MHIKDLCRIAHEESRRGGWYDADGGKRNTGELIALMHSELSEMLETLRKLDDDGNVKPSPKTPEFSALEEEAADLAIRLGDFCGYLGLRLEDAISAKMAFNRTRGYRHGGKKF